MQQCKAACYKLFNMELKKTISATIITAFALLGGVLFVDDLSDVEIELKDGGTITFDNAEEANGKIAELWAIIDKPIVIWELEKITDEKEKQLAEGLKDSVFFFEGENTYLTFRNDLFGKEISIADYSAVIAIVRYENSKDKIIKTAKDLNDFKKNPNTFLKNKFK